MIKHFIFYVFNLAIACAVFSQQSSIDSLLRIANTGNDTVRLCYYNGVIEEYTESNPDSALYYAEQVLQIAQKLKLKLEEVHALGKIGYCLINKGNYPRSLQSLLEALKISEDPASEAKILPVKFPPSDEFTDRHSTAHVQRIERLARIHQYLGILYGNANNYQKAKFHYLQAKRLAEQTSNASLLSITNNTLGRLYLSSKDLDSAFLLAKEAYYQSIKAGYKKYLGSTLLNLGRIYAAKGDKDSAINYYEQAIIASAEHDYYFRGIAAGNLALADLYRQSGNMDSVFMHIQNALDISQFMNAPDLLLRSYTALAEYYKTFRNTDSIVKYQGLIIKINDSLFNVKQAQQFQNIDFDEQQRQQQIEAANTAYRNKLRTYVLVAGLAIFLFIAIILWRNSLQRKRSNSILSRQKNELEVALKDLTTAQNQLVQSEKMASLGELTAGIAHEIQNPLNFVNNFSDINKELADELKTELATGNMQLAKEIADDIKENSEKINHHGRRADEIVKGMLQHSRTSSGQREKTDINALCEEYLRLAYHGLKAKDKSFNTRFETNFDDHIEKVNVVPQEIGRVILNLINNAFYAVNEKSKSEMSNVKDGLSHFKPLVTVSTKNLGDKIEISIKDNGNGIPDAIKEKIFQPFFTTKPAGQGTGLGLSLSYDIVKAHGGDIKVTTEDGTGSQFLIVIPA